MATEQTGNVPAPRVAIDVTLRDRFTQALQQRTDQGDRQGLQGHSPAAGLLGEQLPAARAHTDDRVATVSGYDFGRAEPPPVFTRLPPIVDARGGRPAALSKAVDDLVPLLQRLCSTMYVAEHRPHVMLALDGVLAGTSAEILHDGGTLRVRLRARDEGSYRLMASRQATLSEALAAGSDQLVSIEILRGEGAADGRAR